MDQVSIVIKLFDIFSNDLFGLSSDKEIEFYIDLVLSIEPIYMTLYRMTPIKLKELKDQLRDLLDKNFIHPSVSLWGSPALFVKKNDGFL
jgi:hypothetical protein